MRVLRRETASRALLALPEPKLGPTIVAIVCRGPVQAYGLAPDPTSIA
jgi:hypothetical protein